MRTIIACTLTLLIIALSSPISAGSDPTVRFYKINKKGQQRHLEFTRNTDEQGCHNFLKRTKVHRVAQVRFDYCKVFTERDCAEGSEIAARWEGKEEPTTKLTQGSLWLLADTDNVKIRSWECVKP